MNISLLKDTLEDVAGCRQCMDSGTYDEVEDFVHCCNIHGYDLCTLLDTWKTTQRQSKCTVTIDEFTYEVATDLIICCN